MKKYTLAIMLFAFLSGCSTLSGQDGPSVRVVDLEPLQSEGLELRFALKLRVQNPNSAPLAYDGMSVNLDLDGRGLASGVSDESGEIPRFSETVLTVPVSISAFSAFRQVLARISDTQSEKTALTKPLAYSLKGKLGAAGSLVATRFKDQGELDLFSGGDGKELNSGDGVN